MKKEVVQLLDILAVAEEVELDSEDLRKVEKLDTCE